jgi:hypothetical protein
VTGVDRPDVDKPLPGWLNLVITIPILLGVAAIAGLGFFGSFHGMREAARPYLHDDAWIAPAGIDTAILVFTAYDLRAVRARVPVPWLRYAVLGLNFATIYFNSAASDAWLGKAFHAAMPVLYIGVVEAIRTSLSRWVAKVHDEHFEPIPWNMWLTPLATFRMWYRRNRWRIKTIDEMVSREQARELAVLRLKERAGKLSRFWWPRWKKQASADELWAIRTYALSPDGAMRRTAAAVTKGALSAPAHTPERAHTAAGDQPPVHAPDRARTPAPAAPARQDAAQPRTGTGDAKWDRLMADPESVRAWETYRRLRIETRERPPVKDVHELSGTSKDRSSVSRWCKQFDARWDVHGPGEGSDGEAAAAPAQVEDVHAQSGVHARTPGGEPAPGVHAPVHVGAHTDVHTDVHTGTEPAAVQPAAHTGNGKVPAR